MADDVLLEAGDGRTVLITIARPDQRNAADAPLTMRAAREPVCRTAGTGRSAGLRAHPYGRVHRSEDAVAGPRAFAGKRPPRWAGR